MLRLKRTQGVVIRYTHKVVAIHVIRYTQTVVIIHVIRYTQRVIGITIAAPRLCASSFGKMVRVRVTVRGDCSEGG